MKKKTKKLTESWVGQDGHVRHLRPPYLPGLQIDKARYNDWAARMEARGFKRAGRKPAARPTA